MITTTILLPAPNHNRQWFRNMYKDLQLRVPETARQNLKYDPAPPAFNFLNGIDATLGNVDQHIAELEERFFVDHMQQYFGMVKCIDFNIGKLNRKLKDLGIEDNTIIVYTSDHGGMKLEHGVMNKNFPYEASAGIPLIVKYPNRIPAGKLVETAYSSVDFAPTLLGLMGMSLQDTSSWNVNFQGMDASHELVSPEMVSSRDDQIIFSFKTGNRRDWSAAIQKGYKLVFSVNDIPWLFDLNKDPDEMINFATSSWHQPIFEKLRDALIQAMKTYEIPMGKLPAFIFLDVPACYDRRDVLPITVNHAGGSNFCTDLGISIPFQWCQQQPKIREHCPLTCKECCQDSPGKMWINESEMTCDSIQQNLCRHSKVKQFCPVTCNAC